MPFIGPLQRRIFAIFELLATTMSDGLALDGGKSAPSSMKKFHVKPLTGKTCYQVRDGGTSCARLAKRL
jgi:hypothetical protein